jgi:hypothetical protein
VTNVCCESSARDASTLGYRSEQGRLLPQHRQIRDRFTTISRQHRQIDSDPARLMHRATEWSAFRRRTCRRCCR